MLIVISIRRGSVGPQEVHRFVSSARSRFEKHDVLSVITERIEHFLCRVAFSDFILLDKYLQESDRFMLTDGVIRDRFERFGDSVGTI
jgi:hypothetical protein